VRASALALAVLLSSCSRSEPPSPPRPSPVDLLSSLTVQDGQGVHGEFHKINPVREREYWEAISTLPVAPGGDDSLLEAVEKVYTRFDVNFYHGAIWHWPYLNSRKAVALADKLFREYPDSPRAERTLWLKAFALRCPPLDPHEEYAAQFENYREQMAWKADPEAARAVLGELVKRFPEGRHAGAARKLVEQKSLTASLLSEPGDLDPRDPR
jgi:hypothetical protein